MELSMDDDDGADRCDLLDWVCGDEFPVLVDTTHLFLAAVRQSLTPQTKLLFSRRRASCR
jgi:hypothetical protein